MKKLPSQVDLKDQMPPVENEADYGLACSTVIAVASLVKYCENMQREVHVVAFSPVRFFYFDEFNTD